MSDTGTPYRADFFLWSKEQAAALRSAVQGGSNRQLDWENVADLQTFGELAPAARARIRETTYTEDQILGEWLPPPARPEG